MTEYAEGEGAAAAGVCHGLVRRVTLGATRRDFLKPPAPAELYITTKQPRYWLELTVQNVDGFASVTHC